MDNAEYIDPSLLRKLAADLRSRKMECTLPERAMIYAALIFMANNTGDGAGQEEQDGTRER